MLKNGLTLYFQDDIEVKFEHQILESFHHFSWKTYILNPTWRDLSYLFSFPSVIGVKDPVKFWLHLLEESSIWRREHSQRAISFRKSLVFAPINSAQHCNISSTTPCSSPPTPQIFIVILVSDSFQKLQISYKFLQLWLIFQCNSRARD